ncbi:ABC transporter ATP-binding protein [Devosia sp. YIM 151766]|uniref:dipeptide ABC transporter ATP-binding protein n=1 Tax=Devosia sp. YIM 151766 TaxID=3017325 RepID=UPI00255C49E5|nr:ABC transporter ATP-binding protein [Devosia sp. YIM 151766]WIY53399.1 ABC transporter ATP-binding protein [Devosia sp. YIM 151766]
MALVDIDKLTIRFGGQPAVSALSLHIEAGGRFGIIGESGSGKSLTALAIAGLLPDTADVAGTIRFDGTPLPGDEKTMARLRGKRIGMVFQEPMTALNPLMNIGDQIGEAADLSDSGADIDALLGEVGLQPDHARRFPHQLSGGQRQRAMIAMALASEPDLLIADEPTSALDAITQRLVLDLIAAICDRRGMTLLFISHDMRAVAALCSHIGVMQAGKLVETGETRAVLQNPQAEYTRKLVAASRMERRISRPRSGAPLLEVDGVSRDYGQGGFWLWGRKPLRAVDRVSFAVGAGECVALVGPSGCGKTTLARMIVGLDSATEGRMRLDGQSYRGRDLQPPLRAGLSLVFQDPFSSFDPRMSIGQSLAEPLHLLGPLAAAERAARLHDAILSVGLDPAMLARYPHEFSGGQRQRLAIARAMVTRPRFVVLDEPVSALDVSVRGEVLTLLARLQAEHGLTFLIISHDLDMVAAMADRVLVMEAGRIVEEGTPDALFAQPQHALTRALMAARLPDVA